MEIRTLDFFLGLALGIALGVGLTLLNQRLRIWFGVSELSRLRADNQALKRRLSQKDRYIGRMLKETERLAEKLGQGKGTLPPPPEPES